MWCCNPPPVSSLRSLISGLVSSHVTSSGVRSAVHISMSASDRGQAKTTCTPNKPRRHCSTCSHCMGLKTLNTPITQLHTKPTLATHTAAEMPCTWGEKMARNKKNLMSLEKYCVYFKFCHLKKKIPESVLQDWRAGERVNSGWLWKVECFGRW